MPRTTTELTGKCRQTGESVSVPIGARLSDIYQYENDGRCMAVAHFDGRRIRVTVTDRDWKWGK